MSALSGWRYRLTLVATSGGHTGSAEEQKRAFAAIRKACGLKLHDVAKGWGVGPTTIAALEAGDLRFPCGRDLQAAISQLWCWRAEGGVRG